MTRRLPLTAALALAALALAACGDEESTTTVTETAEPTAETTATTTGDNAGTTSTATDADSDGTPPGADIEVDELTPFTTPSANIGCYIDPETVRCDIAERDWEPPKAPKGCKLDYGQGITLSAGAAPEFVCAGDTALGAGEPLAYGSSISAGLLRCESEESGMSCRDIESGRGFSLAREGYELF